MKVFKVKSKYVSFNPGQVLFLDERQADARAPFLDALDTEEDAPWPRPFRVTTRTGFRVDEVIGVEGDLHPAWTRHFDLLEDTEPEEEPEGTPEPGETTDLDRTADDLEGESQEAIEDEGPAPEEEPGTDRQELIKVAIQELIDKGSKEDFMDDGRPRVVAIESVLGFGIKAPERDEAFRAMKDGE